MRSFLTLCVTLMLMVPELLAGNLGLPLGLPFFGAVYFAGAFGIAYGIVAGGCAGLMLDLLYCRGGLSGAISGMLIVLAAAAVTGGEQRRLPGAALAAGGVCGGAVALSNALECLIAGSPFPEPGFFTMLIFQISGGALFMLPMTALFDAVNLRCDLPGFAGSSSDRRFNGGGAR